jgi:hypothetical protein
VAVAAAEQAEGAEAPRAKVVGLTLSEHRTLGRDTERDRAWGGFTVATVS